MIDNLDPMKLKHDTVLLCRDALVEGGLAPPRWTVTTVLADGALIETRTGEIFGIAYRETMRRAFADGMHASDLVVTNRTMPEAIEHIHEPHPKGTILCLEGGGLHIKGFWTTVSGRTRLAGDRFHESALCRVAEIEAPLPMDERSFCTEIEVRHSWRAIAFARNVADRQLAEDNPALTASALEALANEKQASVRQLGCHSPHFEELYGRMLTHEWDDVWQRWQAEALLPAPEAA